jgi:phosphatidylglycerophosphatase B
MFTKEKYLKMSAPFRGHPGRIHMLLWMNRILTVLAYVSYIGCGILLILRRSPWIIRYLLVPGVLFAAVSIFRMSWNMPRPYEQWEIRPLLPKETKGKSFPSRHVFSMAMVAMAVWSVYLPLGVILLAAAVFLAWVRVVSGVHFPRDVIAGALIGIGFGIFGFWII